MAALFIAGAVCGAAPPLPVIPANNFNVTNYGAKGDGLTDNTAAISNAISAAVAAKGGTVEFPAAAASYLSGPITLYGNINLQVDANATLQMLPYGTYPASSCQFIYCDKVQNVEICGGGTIDGQGQAWWVAYTNNSSLSRPLLLQLESCVGLYIHDITFQNPPYHV